MNFFLPQKLEYERDYIQKRVFEMIGYFGSVENKTKKAWGSFLDVTTSKRGGFTGISATINVDTTRGCAGAPIFSAADQADREKLKCHCDDHLSPQELLGIQTGYVNDGDEWSRASILTPEITQWIIKELSQNVDSFNKVFEQEIVQDGQVKHCAKWKPIPPLGYEETEDWTGGEFACISEDVAVT